MLKSMKEHYLQHQEELGAMPAPSRLKMIEESMHNIKRVVKERDEEATSRAVEIFRRRLQQGIYRYPPGPPPRPGAHDKTIVVKVTLSKFVGEERLRELFGRYDVFEPHKGIVRVDVKLPEEVLRQKESAEKLWIQYVAECSDVRAYHQWSAASPSVYDYTDVELVPGVYANDTIVDGGDEGCGDIGGHKGVLVAARIPVPPPKERPPPPKNPLERLKAERRSYLARTNIQLGYFPNVTLQPPRHNNVEAVPRPVHPDEIEGPWEAYITYDRKDGLSYVQALGVTSIDGAKVLGIAEHIREPQPFAEVDPVYREALRREKAREETLMKWPHVPEWKYEYSTYTRKHLADIVQYNYTNVVDYLDREVLLTGKSVWECPIHIDYTCGGSKTVPPHAKKPVRYMDAGIASVGATDI